MRHIHISILSILLLFAGLVRFSEIRSQNNTGIGTSMPHPSALLQISDSSRGVLIPRTDTIAIAAYVNSISPSPGIADGLLIMDTNLNTYVYYDASNAVWKLLISLVGPTGPKGFRGPAGPTGPTGLGVQWHDSIGDPVFDPLVDTCGDWFLNTATGKIWWAWCDSVGGAEPPRYIDTNSYDSYIGELMAPDERVIAANVHCNTLLLQNMSAIGVSLKNVSGLTYSINVERDEIAYIWVTAYGTARKAFAGSDLSYAQYDINFAATNYQPGAVPNFYYGRVPDSIAHIVTIGPNGPPAPSETIGLYELVNWHLSASFVLEGPQSPFPCAPCGPPVNCAICTPLNGNVTINLQAGNRNTGSAGSGDILILADDLSTDEKAHMNVFAVIRRNPSTWPWKK